MYNETDILARLRAGETIDDIMDEMMVVVNSAVKAKEAEDEAKRKAEEAAAWQMKDAELVAEVMNDYFKKYCGGAGNEISAAALVESSDLMAQMLKAINGIDSTVKKVVRKNELPVKIKFVDNREEPDVQDRKATEDWASDAIMDFLKSFDLF